MRLLPLLLLPVLRAAALLAPGPVALTPQARLAALRPRLTKLPTLASDGQNDAVYRISYKG